jgi:hypothetical protein
VNKSCCGSFWAVGLIVLLLWVINTGVIAREEHYPELEFGDAYRAQRRLGRVQLTLCCHRQVSCSTFIALPPSQFLHVKSSRILL